MCSERLNVVVFGSGPAGLSAAMEIEARGNDVEVITPDVQRFPHSVYTTDKFLPPELVEKFFSPDHIKRVPYLRVITPNNTDFRIKTSSGSYFMVNYPSSLKAVQGELSRRTNIQFSEVNPSILNGIKVTDGKGGVNVLLDGQKKQFDLAVDATGTEGKIDQLVNPQHDADYLSEYVYGETVRGILECNEMILVIGPAGGTSWVNQSIQGEGFVDVVFSAFGPRKHFVEFLHTAKPRLNKLLNFISDKPGVNINSFKPESTYSGIIRAQPTKQPLTNHVYAVGEAAGMAKPGAGDSIQRAIMSGWLIAESLNQGHNPRKFHQTWSRLWRANNFYFSGMLARLEYQENGTLGGTFDQGGKWAREANSEETAKLVEQFERYIVDGKLSFSLFMKLMSTKQYATALTITALKHLELCFKDPVLPNKLPLPPIE